MEEKKKIEVVTAAGRLDSATFVIQDEDHTIGNSLRYMLMKNPKVSFAGYSIPHPSKPEMNVRVQTSNESIEAVSVVKESLDNLKEVCLHVLQVFETEVALFTPEDEMEQ
eukprot:TRINITY_DN4433_c0_g1_i1.p1 TRINITY_DN4433_c0_g1~~TRINITY_DN4433_c0_g1_i1.p1  ORF type:complete len:110 (+),score=34.37 TRINITY_DN4433_c0_g1_i1:90-419(+)